MWGWGRGERGLGSRRSGLARRGLWSWAAARAAGVVVGQGGGGGEGRAPELGAGRGKSPAHRLIRSRHCGAVRSPSQSELSVGSQWLSSAAPWAAAEGGSPGSGARPLPGPPAPPAAAAAAHTSGRKGGPNPPPPLTPTTPATPLAPGPAAPAPAVAASSVGLSAIAPSLPGLLGSTSADQSGRCSLPLPAPPRAGPECPHPPLPRPGRCWLRPPPPRPARGALQERPPTVLQGGRGSELAGQARVLGLRGSRALREEVLRRLPTPRCS